MQKLPPKDVLILYYKILLANLYMSKETNEPCRNTTGFSHNTSGFSHNPGQLSHRNNLSCEQPSTNKCQQSNLSESSSTNQEPRFVTPTNTSTDTQSSPKCTTVSTPSSHNGIVNLSKKSASTMTRYYTNLNSRTE